MKEIKARFILFTCLLLLNVLSTLAQNYSISGRVMDTKTNEPIIGANVFIQNSSFGTVTDLNGLYVIKKIPFDTITLTISYISYQTQKIKINFTHDNSRDQLVLLNEKTTDIDEVTVLGNTEGQVKAMLEQKTAANIKNVVSSEQIEQFPDMNAADVMQRIPGITVQRDQGEGRYVQLRGTPPEYTNFNINGEQIPSPEGNVRYVGMDVIAADQIEYIEITKVLTPDMDADGIAGNVNIKTKEAPEGTPELSISLAGGYNELMKTTNQYAQLAYGYRYNKIGFQVNASYFNKDYGSHNMEFDYTRGPTLSQAQSGDSSIGAENFHILYDDIELRHYTINRKRIGISSTLDYKFNSRNKIYLRGMYNNFSDDETRRRKSHGVSDANEPLIYRSAGMEFDIRDRSQIQQVSTVNLGGEHYLNNGIKLDYEASYAEASEEIPDYISTSFDQGLVSIRVDKSDPRWPEVHFLEPDDSVNAYNYNSYGFDGLTFRNNLVEDKNYTSKLNLSLPYTIGRNQYGSLKIGGKIRSKHKKRDNSAWVSKKYEKINIYTQPAPTLNLTTVAGDFSESNLLDHGYEIPISPDPDLLREFYEKNQQHFKLNEPDTWEDNFQEDYTANEDIYSAYLMLSHTINKLLISGGVRYEKTVINYTTQNAWVELNKDSTDRGLLKTQLTTAQRTIPFVLPQVMLKYALNSRSNIRAGATYSYSRPNFDDILPYRKVNDEGDVNKGNPTLKFPLSFNLDLLAETYLMNNGIISGGIFYKKIENPVFKFVRRAHEGDNFNQFGLKEITMAVNGIDAIVYGAEVQTQMMMSFLTGFLRNFGIFINYAYTESAAQISKRYPQNEKDIVYRFNDYSSDFFTSSEDKETIPLQGQAKHSGNLALFYQSQKFYAKLSGVYHTEFLTHLGNDAGLDVYYDKSFHLDFNANYQITKSLNCFVDINNLTNEPLVYYLGSREYFKQQEYYSITGRLGIKLNF